MDPYLTAKWVHILSSTILFGTGLGTALHLWLTHLSRDVAAIAVATRNTVRADWAFTLPSVIVQPMSGAVLIELAGYDWGEGWLVLALLLYGIAGICWLVVLKLQLRMRNFASEARAAGTALPEEYFRCARAWFWLGWPAFTAVIVIFWLMVNRPEL
ncbi:DUF2269 domain-containing protein [Pelagibius sp. Alg239-R121]|uniref:DUF2269 family protein n=1 Tax=Pelagibius sp. Alg239-R121 TaxID=2993448 RepID=UPI0024A6F9F7|nr:DUF2269 domain-containing protein [Pelagibius sp. Alg239-R121]